MWYKTAKYGTLWDRLGPESEEEIDRILNECTIREKIVDPKTKTEKEIRKIDYKKLDQLLKTYEDPSDNSCKKCHFSC